MLKCEQAGARPLALRRVPSLSSSFSSRQRLVVRAQVPKEALKDSSTSPFFSLFQTQINKEGSRKYRRNVYSPTDWVNHRATERYLRHIKSMFSSGNVAALLGPTLAVAGVATVLELIEVAQTIGSLPDWPSNFKPISALPFTITGASLSLLLVFRTNASYARWDEARKMWGLMVNRSRDIVRQANRWFPEEEDGLKDMFVRYMGALPKSMMVHLRTDEDLRLVLNSVPGLLPDEVAAIEASPHRPMHVLQVMGAIIQAANLHPQEKMAMDLNLTAFEDVLGGCERIYKTPIPVSYTRLTSRFLIVYLFALPFCLVHDLHAAAIPACALTTFFMLGIEEIGVQIEEPFSILALEVMAETIAGNARVAREEAKVKIPALVANSKAMKAAAGNSH